MLRLTALLLLTSFATLKSQSSYPVSIIADAREGEIRLRWAPDSPEIWKLGNQNGYRLERAEAGNPGSTIVLSEEIFPLPLPDWEPIADTLEAALFYAGALYGSNGDPNDPDRYQPVGEERQVVEQNTYAFALFAAEQSFTVAKAASLGYVDGTVEKGKRYVYRVSINGLPKSAGTIAAAEVAIGSNQRTRLPVPAINNVKWDDSTAVLTWNQSLMVTSYSSYSVERSEPGRAFEKVNDRPLFYLETDDNNDPNLYFTDSLNSNTIEYTYRIKGRSPFGVDGPASEPVTGTGIPKPLPFPPRLITLRESAETKTAYMEWTIPREAEGKIKGFNVYRAKSRNSPYELITPRPLPAIKRFYTIENPVTATYYVVKLIDENDNEVTSVPSVLLLRDLDPPSPPTGLLGSMDSMGNTSLSWSPNPEDDHQGYRVYISNQREGVFIQITEDAITRETYEHKVAMKTLAKNIYFKLKAIDFFGNYSDFSEAVSVERPDLYPPAPASIYEVTGSRENISLAWTQSPSDDVIAYRLERQPTDQISLDWDVVYATPQPPFNFTDADLQRGRSYRYRVAVEDDAGYVTMSDTVTGTRIDDGSRAEITSLSGVLATDESQVELVFDCIYPVDPLYFHVYRARGDDPMATLGMFRLEDKIVTRIGRQKFKIVDKTIRPEETYTYKLIARYPDGGFTPMSQEIRVTVD